MLVKGPSGWARVAAALWLGVAALLAAPARAEERAPPPPAEAPRLIRIGPQALVSEDERGNVMMVDEPEPQRTPADVVSAIVQTMTAALAGAVLSIDPRDVGASGLLGRNRGGRVRAIAR